MSRKGRPSSSRRASRRPRRGCRAPRPLWPLVGLALVGAAAAVVASRRHRLASDPDGPDGEREAAGPSESSSVPEAPPGSRTGQAPGPEQIWIAGPAGNLFVRDSAETAGDRLPVLFVHGLAGNGGQWALQLDHLGRRRQALAVDLRGHGDSDPAEDGAYEIASFAADVAAVADQFGLRRFVLAGHSLGAAVAIAYAAGHGDRVAGLLLVDPNGDQTRIPRRQLEPFLAALRARPLEELESYYRQLAAGGDRDAAHWVIEDLRLTHEDAVATAIASATEFPPLPALARYRGPTLAVISDANDLPYSLHRLLPALPVQLVRGTGHWLMMDRPEAFNAILDAFLEQVEGVPG